MKQKKEGKDVKLLSYFSQIYIAPLSMWDSAVPLQYDYWV